jgi:hypothetical protein
MQGRLVNHYKVDIRGELESLFWLAGHLMGLIFRKWKGKKGKKKYATKMFRV